ncbi:histidinol-phosphate transaminase [Polaribacter reichenbachii]|uniref:Histidinol-phosphate aminotransferase n=1 Tax=Polaribacter reichenbachii TaxID=996801 RepID=A0A1B8TPF3_9FLAO|nr:histidinol-phosphate transaminase [Polaribacter reichenbachii]APZ46990.1 histidinol-phosphate transaminase [Polaribacter reichenbachii]AUC17633.1 histidinol-phosphate transaminase [Polaribacter reichenbachii]OBY61495.1 histidinol phosphate aminotransferase [Polaribacter reichenbachii]
MKTDFNINNLVRENIKSLKPYSSARDEYKDITYNDMIFLDANENPFENGVNRYPDPQQLSVKDILSEIKGVDQENILLGNGSDEVLDLIYRAFCEPKIDNIITLPPTYGMYSVLASLNDIENKEVLLSSDFQPSITEILNASNKNSKILFLCSPNNPTGNSFSEKAVHELLIKFKGLVVIDEAYIDFSTQKSWLKKLDKFPNLIITQTLSKAYGLAGIRLGVCYASKEIIKILNNIKPPYNVNELTQQRAIDRLQKIDEINNEVAQLISERKRLKQELECCVSFIEKVYPSDGNFLLLKVDDANKRYKELIEYGVVIRNRTTQPLCENCLRISVGICEENQRLIRALKSLQ